MKNNKHGKAFVVLAGFSADFEAGCSRIITCNS
jgi:hypothetical protein